VIYILLFYTWLVCKFFFFLFLLFVE